MTLGGALQIGRSGLLASQAAIEVAGNNLANVATRGYHRQTVALTPATSQEVQRGIFIGRGVRIDAILRRVDEALEGRLRNSISSQAGALVQHDVLTQIEALHNELSDIDLSTRLSDLFNAFSELANSPQDASLRSLTVQQAKRVGNYLQELHTGLTALRTQTDQAIDLAATAANDLLTRIEQINQSIVAQEGGSGGASGLRDQRDLLLGELSEYIDISVQHHETGTIDVYVGSIPIILNGKSRGVDIRKQSVDGQLQVELVTQADGSVLDTGQGKLGAMIRSRTGDIDDAIDTLNSFANSLIYEVNKLHASGQGLAGFTSVTGTNGVDDPAAALNTATANLPFTPVHGSFKVHVTDTTTGIRTSATVNIDLDGLNGDDTTLADLAAQLDAVGSLTATVLPDGRLRITTDADHLEVSFSNDTSGVLAALGVNTFFSGTNAGDIDINSVIDANLDLLAASNDHNPTGNGAALAIAGLRDTNLSTLGNASLMDVWSRHVEDYAIRLSQAGSRVESETVVRESLAAQQQSISGVSTDEEAINLLAYQRAYQGSARFLQVVDELLQTLISMV